MGLLRNLFRSSKKKRRPIPKLGQSMNPIKGYPSSVVDSEGCEFGFEMYYHIGYAYHLQQRGLLTGTISCRDTRCFYWFSPDHQEHYQRRQWVPHYPTIDQHPHQSPEFSRWTVPNFVAQYGGKMESALGKPIVPIFNKYNGEWDGPPVNFFSKESLLEFAQAVRSTHQVIYFRPTSQIVADDSEVLDLHEKEELRDVGVLMGEELYEQWRDITFNTFQLSVLADSPYRAVVQGGAAYMNALCPGRIHVLHRRGAELEAGTYQHLEKAAQSKIVIHDNDSELLQSLQAELQNTSSKHRAA